MFVVGLRSLFEWRSSLITFPICFFQFTEGPMAHDQPTYASVPGIRVFGKYAYCPYVFVERLINNSPSTDRNDVRQTRQQ